MGLQEADVIQKSEKTIKFISREDYLGYETNVIHLMLMGRRPALWCHTPRSIISVNHPVSQLLEIPASV